MPSSALHAKAFQTIAPRAAAFTAALTLTAIQLRGWLAEHPTAAGPDDGATFGAFAAGRLNAARLAGVLTPRNPRDADWVESVKRALTVLEDLLGRGDDIFRVRVAPGADLAAVAGAALADAGRAFGAARLGALAQSSAYRPEHQELLAGGFPFGRWSSAERRLAPPLVIDVDGGGAVVAGLGAYLDGNQAFVLVVSGDAPPAPLARLISPGVTVVQASADDDPLAPSLTVAGPAVIAIMPPTAAKFVHLASAGVGLGPVDISFVPAQEPRRPVGAQSVFQQQQDLQLLAAMRTPSTVPTAPEAPVAPPSVSSPVQLNGNGNGHHADGPQGDLVGALATWLLSRVDLSGLETDE